MLRIALGLPPDSSFLMIKHIMRVLTQTKKEPRLITRTQSIN